MPTPKPSFFQRIFGAKPTINNNSNKPQGTIDTKNLQENYGGGAYAGSWGGFAAFPYMQGDAISRINSQYAGINMYAPLDIPQSRHLGMDYPWIRSLNDCNVYRTQSRFMARTNCYAISILNGVKSYVIGNGFKTMIQSEKNKTLAKKVQQIVDEWCLEVDWYTIQNEFWTRNEVDGEAFLHVMPQRDGKLKVRFIEPTLIQPPEGESNDEWSLGIKAPVEDSQAVEAYGVMSWDQQNVPYIKILPAKEIIHSKINCTMQMKRGIPSISFDTLTAFGNAQKLSTNLQVTAAVQAGVTYVRQFENNTQPQVDEFISSQVTQGNIGAPFSFPLGAPSAFQGYELMGSGSILDIPKTMNYVESPSAKNTEQYISVLEMTLRQAAKHWQCPDWLATSRSDSTSYASSLTAESPFLRTCLRSQQNYKRIFTQVINKVLNNAAVAGLIPLDWKKSITVTLDAPSLETREILKQSQADALLHSMGCKSLHEIAASAGGDFEKTQALMRKEQEMKVVVPANAKPPISAAGNGHDQGESPLPRAT